MGYVRRCIVEVRGSFANSRGVIELHLHHSEEVKTRKSWAAACRGGADTALQSAKRRKALGQN
jgi:hypothetical protein